MKKINRKSLKNDLKALPFQYLLKPTELRPFLKDAKEVADLKSCGRPLKTLVFYNENTVFTATKMAPRCEYSSYWDFL